MPAEWAGARDAKNLPYQKAPHGLQPCQRSGLSRRALLTRPPGRLVRRNRATPRPGLPAAPAAGPACGRWWYRSGGRSGGELAEGHRCSAGGFATRFPMRRSSFQEHLGSAGVAQLVGGEAVKAMACGFSSGASKRGSSWCGANVRLYSIRIKQLSPAGEHHSGSVVRPSRRSPLRSRTLRDPQPGAMGRCEAGFQDLVALGKEYTGFQAIT